MGRTVADVALLLDATAGADPDDAVTDRATGRIPPSYMAALQRDGLRGVRLGVLTALFGEAPEDQRAGSVVRTAVREMAGLGAETVDLPSTEVPTEPDGVAIIRFEFKFDLEEYLRRTPRAPVRTLSEILDKGLVHPSLVQSFRRSADVPTLDSEEYRAVVARNARLRDALVRLMDDNHVGALVYPTLRRTSAKIGAPQAGGNCAASAATGCRRLRFPPASRTTACRSG
jgi:Asp-tRNA(Asn)/Glu-tRNA(Gln) amidotransferase A subunit family amidase